MHMKQVIQILIALFLTSAAQAQELDHYLNDPEGTPRDHQLDISYMKLEVSFEPQAGKVIGTVTHTFEPIRKAVDTVFWDAPGIDVKSVELRKKGDKQWASVSHYSNAEGLITRFASSLAWDTEYEIRMNYEAFPRKGIYFIGWNSPVVTDKRNQTRQQIWTQGQGIDHRHWIPMYDDMDDKFITETIVTFDEDFKVLSNGRFDGDKNNKDGTRTWHYCMEKPHAGYLLMLAIDRYAVKETKTSRGTPVQFWYYPEHEDKKDLTSLHTEKIIEFLEDETGFAYPWGTYSQVMVQDFMYGAMENTSATIFGDFFNVDEYSFNDRNYVSVNAHELTHQWFGDLVTARSRKGTWLQESFATYYAKLFMGSVYGEDHYSWTLRNEVNSALRASESDNYPVAHTRGGTPRVYPKGSTVLHMLRYVLGNEEYLRVIDHYLDEHAFGNVETNDLIQACEDVLGRNMRWFFDQWVYRGGEPHYEVKRSSNTDKTVLFVKQIQDMDFTVEEFKMPIRIGLYFKDGEKLERTEWIDEESEFLEFEHNGLGEPEYVLFDINSEVTKRLSFKKSTTELLQQLAKAEHMIDRYDALIGLSEVKLEEKAGALRDQYSKESYWAIKAEIIRQLLKEDDNSVWIQDNLKGADVRIRRVVLEEAKNIQPYTALFLHSLNDKSYRNISTALRRIVREDHPRAVRAFNATKEVHGQNHNVRLMYLELALEEQEKNANTTIEATEIVFDMNPVKEIRNYTSNLYEFRTRISAMEIVKRHPGDLVNDQVIVNMLEAVSSPNRRLAGPAKSTLSYLSEMSGYKSQIQNAFDRSDLSDLQKKIIKESGLITD